MKDALWQDMPKDLPNGAHIAIGELSKAREGKDFYYYPPDEKLPTLVKDVDLQDYYMCHRFYHKFSVMGLPHGQGWANETPDCQNVILIFDELVNQTKIWLEEKANR